MRIISKPVDINADTRLLDEMTAPDRTIFLDIETTGLSAAKDRIYLIGCLYRQEGNRSWNLIQWFDQTGLEEKEVLSSFLIFSSSYDALVHYNGDRFDLPFIKERIAACGLEDTLSRMDSVDLYRILKPARRLLGLPDYRQQTVEAFLGTGRTEASAGKDLIKDYRQFIASQSTALFDRLTGHNEADLCGLACLSAVMVYAKLPSLPLQIRRAQANAYTDYDGTPGEELFLFFRTAIPLPAPIYAGADRCYIKIDGGEGILKVPLFTGELKYFYAGYKDYYFLPVEDMAIHKNLARYVEKSHRIQARPETCYTRRQGTYLPQWDLFRTPFFKRSYEDPAIYFELTDEYKKDRHFLSEYASYVLSHIMNP